MYKHGSSTLLIAAASMALSCHAPKCPAQDALSNAAEVRSFYETSLRSNGIVGSSLALIRDGHVVFQDRYGLQGKEPDVPVDENTTYHWASCTKTFTGVAIM